MKNVVYGNKFIGKIFIILGLCSTFLMLITTIYQDWYFIFFIVLSLILVLYGIYTARFKIVFEDNYLTVTLIKDTIIKYEDIKRFKIRRSMEKQRGTVPLILYFSSIILTNGKIIKLPSLPQLEGIKLTKLLKLKRIKTKS